MTLNRLGALGGIWLTAMFARAGLWILIQTPVDGL
jgi:hypothetical protein